MRPILIVFVGPYVCFMPYFQMVIDDPNDMKCGQVDSEQLTRIFNWSLLVLNGGQSLMIVVMIFWHCGTLMNQVKGYIMNIRLKADIATNDYIRKYRQIDIDNVDSKMINKNNKYSKYRSSDSVHNDVQHDLTISRMKSIVDKQKTKSKVQYDKLNSINRVEYPFNYFKLVGEINSIIKSYRFDIDLLTDSMAVSNCYVLSQSVNIEQKTRNHLYFYYQCSLVILIVSMSAKLVCYLFYVLRVLVRQTNMLKTHQHSSEKICRPKNCLQKIVFYVYLIVSRLYGLHYIEDNKKSGEYVFSSKNVQQDILRLFYVNHEDMFTADQMNMNRKPVDMLVYQEMQKVMECSFRMEVFRIVFENIPQLVLQLLMVYTIQHSNVEQCKQTEQTFRLSMMISTINVLFGVVTIGLILADKVVNGDLVLKYMKKQLDVYLKRDVKSENIGNQLVIDGHIEIWPSMIERLHLFIVSNPKYEQIWIEQKVRFKGTIDDYLECINQATEWEPLRNKVQVDVYSEEYDELSIVGQLVLKKIFEELIIQNSKIEYSNDKLTVITRKVKKKNNRLTVKQQYRIQNGMEMWMKVAHCERIEIKQNWDMLISNDYEDDGIVYVVEEQLFNIDLLIGLLQIGTRLLQVTLEVKDRRMQQMIELYKQKVQSIEVEQIVDKYRNMSEKYALYCQIYGQLQGLQVEVDDIDGHFWDYYQYQQQTLSDASTIRKMFNYQRGGIIVRDDHCEQLKDSQQILHEFRDEQLGYIILENMEMDGQYDIGLLDSIKYIKENNQARQFRLVYVVNDMSMANRKQNARWGDDQEEKGVLMGYMSAAQIGVDEVNVYSYYDNIDTMDSVYDGQVAQQYKIDIFGKMNKVMIYLDQNNCKQIAQLMDRTSNRSSYRVKVLSVELGYCVAIDLVMQLVQQMCWYYWEVESIETRFNYKVDVGYIEILFRLMKQQHPELNVQYGH